MQQELEYLKAVQSEMDSDFGAFRKHVKSRADHIRQLIIAYSRRQQLLELQHAQRGNLTDPSVLMEIQDIRTELEKLRRDLVEIEIKSDYLKKNK
ncbi:hypothetical protein KDA08_05780 [Candidatus Saccharibacteria bacterium]|nr:hypothetical protein [Candidatus Saccharibacteria bacterium]